MVRLDDIVDDELTLKIGKYVGYFLEVGGACGVVYGICTGDNYTTVSGGFIAYFGTVVHRSFKYLQSHKKDGQKGNSTKDNIENLI